MRELAIEHDACFMAGHSDEYPVAHLIHFAFITWLRSA